MEKTVSSLLDKLRWEGLCSAADIASGCGVAGNPGLCVCVRVCVCVCVCREGLLSQWAHQLAHLGNGEAAARTELLFP